MTLTAYRCQVARTPLDASITLPGSKSITNRALIVAGLADGVSLLRNVLLADDTRLMVAALEAMGIHITLDEEAHLAEVTGCGGRLPADEASIFCGNSGTTLRFCTALAALGHGRYEFDGVPRLRQRPMEGLIDVLRALGCGVECREREGFAPFTVHGQGLLHGGHVAFRAPESSQMVSALLLVAPYARGDLLIEIEGALPSATYVRMTTAIMDHFGAAVLEGYDQARDAESSRFIVAAPQHYQATSLTIEPDASSAGYFFAAAALAGGRITVEGLGPDSVQGDLGFVEVLQRMGCTVQQDAVRTTVMGPSRVTSVARPHSNGERRRPALRGLDIDLNSMPDMVPTLAVLALFAAGPTVIRNVANLRLKESDRLAALSLELTKLGARVEERPDGLTIHPPAVVTPAAIDTYDDHRLAMSFALAGLCCPGIVINDPECVHKTFPDFFQRWDALTAT